MGIYYSSKDENRFEDQMWSIDSENLEESVWNCSAIKQSIMFQVEDYRSLELYTSIQNRKMLGEKPQEKPQEKLN